MSEGTVLAIGQTALKTALLISAPVLGAALAIGIVVSLFQAVTQINEQTLSFLPKILAVLAALVFFGPWMLTQLSDYARMMLLSMAAIH